MTTVRQSHFGGGEIAPEYQGHSSSAHVQRGLATCRNAFPTPTGEWMNRPGFQYLGKTRQTYLSGTLATGPARLVPFVFSDAQTFVLELGIGGDLGSTGSLRFWTGGAQIAAPAAAAWSVATTYAVDAIASSGGHNYRSLSSANTANAPASSPTWWVQDDALEVATPWNILDVDRLKFSQVGDIITVTHPTYPPYEIRRLSNTSWTVIAAVIPPPVPAFDAGQASNGTYLRGIAPIDDATHPLKDWRWKAAVLVTRPDGTIFETQAIEATAFVDDGGGGPYDVNDLLAEAGLVYRSLTAANANLPPSAFPANWTTDGGSGKSCPGPDKPMWFLLNSSIDPDVSDGDPVSAAVGEPNSLRWYRGRGTGASALFGWIGDHLLFPGGSSFFRDDGQEPDFSKQPKFGTNPFSSAGKYPACSAHYDQRRMFAGSDLAPATFWGSALADDNDFDTHFPVGEADSFNFRLAQLRLEDIRSMLGHERLLLFTGAGVWAASGSQGDAISALSIQARKSTGSPGASHLDPIAAQTRILYQTARGNRVRDLVYDYRSQSYVSDDVTVHGRHLLENFTIVDWCFQEHPYSMVWAVRDDGVLLSLTYDSTQQVPVLAWARHDTAGGDDTFEHVCCVPENTTETGPSGSTFESVPDAVYAVVNRQGVRMIERLADRLMPDGADVRQRIFLDSAVAAVAGLNSDVTHTLTAAGATYAAGDILTVTSVGSPFGAADVGADLVFGAVTMDSGVRARIVEFTDATHVQVQLASALPAAFQNVATSDWGYAYARLTIVATAALGHLIGRTVMVLADGGVQGPFVVPPDGGSIALDPPALYFVIGLPYDSDGELLDLASDAVKGNVVGVKSAAFEVVNSRGLKVGRDFDTLSTAKIRDDSDPPALVTETINVMPKGGFSIGGRVCWRQSDPLPLTVVAVTRDVEVGGKP